ncbi:MAG TPA: CVNH domain-containing protein [Candidatus Angelobacter sp.]|jgi:hypothetical protein|nr:CVNH domain-containing protein [Candidatus Angelobacter sp.]
MRLLPAFLAALFLMASACQTGTAQTAVPRGSYTQTCKNIDVKGNILRANCQSSDGKWVHTELKNADRCSEGVVNLDGLLTCQTETIPPGSYLTSCQDIRVLGNNLAASCKNSKGKMVKTELYNAGQCSGDITNLNGSLRCVKADKKTETAEASPEKKKKKKLLLF